MQSLTLNGEAYVWTMPSERLGKHWPDIIKFLQMVDDPEWTTDQVYEEILSQRAQVWGVVTGAEINAIWITKIMTNRSKFGLVWIAAGTATERINLDDGLKLFLACTEKWFREQGCEYIKIIGRRGWQKVLPGFVEHAVELRKAL